MEQSSCFTEGILVINPGATSTKFAVYDGDRLIFKETVEHSAADTDQFHRIFDQYQYRLNIMLATLQKKEISLSALKAIVARGGLLKPLAGGTYAVNEQMVKDLELASRGEHASNLGAVMAYNMAEKLGIPAFIVDPVAVDEMEPIARISGLPELERLSLSHALNMKAVARKVAEKLEKQYEEVNFIVVHLGTGISVAAHKRGRMVDVNNALDEGPFSPDRCGGLPSLQLVKLCYSGKYTLNEIITRIGKQGGIYAYVGTKDIREVEEQAAQGNEQAEFILSAFAYQVSKEIGGMATVLAGEIDQIILTGGIAYSARIVADIEKRVRFIAPVVVVPGEEELESLASGALRVMRGQESVKMYH